MVSGGYVLNEQACELLFGLQRQFLAAGMIHQCKAIVIGFKTAARLAYLVGRHQVEMGALPITRQQVVRLIKGRFHFGHHSTGWQRLE